MEKVEAPRTPAQMWAGVAGTFLLALGVLSLVIEGLHFGKVTAMHPGENFIIWRASGWDTILWMATGALGLAMMGRVDSARTWSLVTGFLFAAMAIWGFISGMSVASIFAVDTTDNITHAILGAGGLLVALMPARAQHAAAPGRTEEARFSRSANGRAEARPRATARSHH